MIWTKRQKRLIKTYNCLARLLKLEEIVVEPKKVEPEAENKLTQAQRNLLYPFDIPNPPSEPE